MKLTPTSVIAGFIALLELLLQFRTESGNIYTALASDVLFIVLLES